MSSYKALFVVVLAAACSQVRIKGNAQRLRPRAGAKDCSISFFFFALFVGFFLAVASTRSAISSSAGDPRSLRPPLADLPKLQGLSLRASAESTPISRCCVRERVHFCTGWSRTERAEASFCRCFFSKKTVGSKKMPPSLLQQTHSGPRPDRRQCRPDCRGQEHVAQRPSGAQERLGRLHAQVSGQRKGEREGSSFFQWFRRHRRGIRRAAAAGSSFFVVFFFSFRHS
jgi:hypothetical protein